MGVIIKQANFTYEQEEIIKDICDQQIQSLIRVSMENRVKKYLTEVGIEMEESEIQCNISVMLKKFDKLKHNTNSLLSLDSVCLSLIKHNLLNNDKRYSVKSHKAHKSNLWKKINVSEQCSNLVMN